MEVNYSGGTKKNVDMSMGWLSKAFTQMGNARVWAVALSPGTTIIPVQGFPVYTKAATPQALLDSARLAAIGTATKDIQVAIIADPPVDTTLTFPAGAECFGVLVKYAGSVLAFKPGIFRFQLIDNATIKSQLWVKPTTNIAEFVWLNITDAGGQASVTRNVLPRVTVIAASSSKLRRLTPRIPRPAHQLSRVKPLKRCSQQPTTPACSVRLATSSTICSVLPTEKFVTSTPSYGVKRWALRSFRWASTRRSSLRSRITSLPQRMARCGTITSAIRQPTFGIKFISYRGHRF